MTYHAGVNAEWAPMTGLSRMIDVGTVLPERSTVPAFNHCEE